MSEATQAGAQTGTDGARRRRTDPVDELGSTLGASLRRLKAIARHQFEVKKDQAAARARGFAASALVALAAGIAVLSVVATAGVVAVFGLVVLISRWMPYPGLAALIVGVGLLAIFLGGGLLIARSLRHGGEKALRAKYERMHQGQRREFGVDVHEMAEEPKP